MRRCLLQIVVLACALAFGASEGRAENKETILVFRGLFAFDTGNGDVVFLNPGETHPPRIMVQQMDFVEGKQPALAADLVTPTMNGYGVGLWKFYRVRLATENLKNGSLVFDREEDANKDPWPVKGERKDGDNRLAWIPRMTTVAPLAADPSQPRKMDPTLLNDAKPPPPYASAQHGGTFPVGKLTPIFDEPSSATQCFTIGERVCTAVADAMELRVTIKDEIAEEDAILFRVQAVKDGPWEPFVVKSGSRIELFALPLTRPARHLDHFDHFFGLPEGDKTAKNVYKCNACTPTATDDPVAPPGTKPIRCAPVQFP